MSISSVKAKRRRGFITTVQIAGIAVWIACVLIIVPTFLNFLVSECEEGTPRLTIYFVCFPPR
jgi:hypothetical protein